MRDYLSEVRAAHPSVTGISYADPERPQTWRLTFAGSAGEAEQSAARAFVDAIDTAAASPVPVPSVVALWQARVALAPAGLMPQVQVALGAMNDPVAAAIWEYGNEIHRDSALLAGIAAALGLSAAQVDALFVAAGEIAS